MRLPAHAVYLRALAALACAYVACTAQADTVTGSGTLDSSSPTMPVVFILDPDCAGQGSSPVAYRTYPVTVTVTGLYTLTMVSPDDYASLYLHSGSFDPTNGFANCVAGVNDDPIQLTYTMTAFDQYFATVFDDTIGQTGGSYDLTISGPGNVLIGGLASEPTPVPTLSLFGLFGLSGLIAGAAAVRARRS